MEKSAVLHEKLLAMNEALLLGSLRQNELAQAAEKLNDQLRAEIAAHQQTELLLTCQKQALEMVTIGTPITEVLKFLVLSVERLSLQPLVVAIHLLNESRTHFEQTVAPSLPPEYHQGVDGAAVSSAIGPCCAAVAGRRRVNFSDIAARKDWPNLAALALSLGLRGGWSTPIISSSGQVYGTFVSYGRECCEPGAQDESLSDIVTRTTVLVIERNQFESTLKKAMSCAHRLTPSSVSPN
jgi:GAF domain-containing protein